MKAYLASAESLYNSHQKTILEEELSLPYLLESFYYKTEFHDELAKRDQCLGFVVDSGAYTFMSGKSVTEPEIEKFAEKYARWVKETSPDFYFELDVDSVFGYEKVRSLRDRIHQIVGRPSIPVWHPSRGKERYLQSLEDYDRVALGGIVSGEWAGNKDLFSWFITQAHKRGVEIHGLGIQNQTIVEEKNFDSVDFSGWQGSRWGYMYHFDGRRVQQLRPDENERVGDIERARWKNFWEWAKYSFKMANREIPERTMRIVNSKFT